MIFNRRKNIEIVSRFNNLFNIDENHKQTSIDRTQKQSSNRFNVKSVTLFFKIIFKSDIMISKIRTTITLYIRMMKMKEFERKNLLNEKC